MQPKFDSKWNFHLQLAADCETLKLHYPCQGEHTLYYCYIHLCLQLNMALQSHLSSYQCLISNCIIYARGNSHCTTIFTLLTSDYGSLEPVIFPVTSATAYSQIALSMPGGTQTALIHWYCISLDPPSQNTSYQGCAYCLLTFNSDSTSNQLCFSHLRIMYIIMIFTYTYNWGSSHGGLWTEIIPQR